MDILSDPYESINVAHHEDDLDIYADLHETTATFNEQVSTSSLDDTLRDEALLFSELNSVENEVKCLRKHNQTLAEQNAALKGNLAAKERQIKILKNNISSLYKTAKMELDRRCQEIADLRREYDSLIFRRIARETKNPTNDPFQSELPSLSSCQVRTIKPYNIIC